MIIKYGEGRTEYGPGVSIELSGDEIAMAIFEWLETNGVKVNGPRTASVRGELCGSGRVYVDPSGFVDYDGKRFYGKGDKQINKGHKSELESCPKPDKVHKCHQPEKRQYRIRKD